MSCQPEVRQGQLDACHVDACNRRSQYPSITRPDAERGGKNVVGGVVAGGNDAAVVGGFRVEHLDKGQRGDDDSEATRMDFWSVHSSWQLCAPRRRRGAAEVSFIQETQRPLP